VFAFGRRRAAARISVAGALVLIAAGVVVVVTQHSTAEPSLVATVRRGGFSSQLTATGVLKPIQSLTYRSPVAGRDAEIIELAPEGRLLKEGDLIVRLGTSELERDADRVKGELRQLYVELQVADGERLEAAAAVQSASEGEGAIAVLETRTQRELAEKKVARLEQESAQLKPLMEKGFITREELGRTTAQLDEAQADLSLARRRADVAEQLTQPREKQRARLQVSQREAQVASLRARVHDAEEKLAQMRALIEACSMYARQPGIVVYEEFVGATPRRKIRVGDRVSASQGLVTIPEVGRMLVEATVSEGEVHLLRAGQPAVVRLEAFPGARLTGQVLRVGTLAAAASVDEKRFDLVIALDPAPLELKPEMTARADVLVGTRDNVLLLPVGAVFDRGGRFVAHVVGASGIESRAIDIGAANDYVVEVVSGLREGERVMLIDSGTAAAPPASPAGERGEGNNALQPR